MEFCLFFLYAYIFMHFISFLYLIFFFAGVLYNQFLSQADFEVLRDRAEVGFIFYSRNKNS